MKQDFLKNIPKSILLKLGKIDLNIPSKNCHEAVDDLLANSVLLGGKRLRPLLTYLFADFFGLDLANVDIPARAIEMVHAASLAHDDVIDEATHRRGAPSINIQASNKRAVLAGDYLLASVIGELCTLENTALVSQMAWVIEELASGEWVQSDAVGSRLYTKEILDEIALKKTSSVMSWCAVAPALLASGSPIAIEKARSFGAHLGLAFQYLDDTLDFGGNSQKDTLLDLQNGQVNSVVYDWLILHPEQKKEYEAGGDISAIFDPSDIQGSIDNIKVEAKAHLDRCRVLLSELKEFSSVPLDQLAKKEETLLFILRYLETRND